MFLIGTVAPENVPRPAPTLTSPLSAVRGAVIDDCHVVALGQKIAGERGATPTSGDAWVRCLTVRFRSSSEFAWSPDWR